MRGTCLHSARRLTCACGQYPHGRSRKRPHATPCGPGRVATRERPGSPWGALLLVRVRRTTPSTSVHHDGTRVLLARLHRNELGRVVGPELTRPPLCAEGQS